MFYKQKFVLFLRKCCVVALSKNHSFPCVSVPLRTVLLFIIGIRHGFSCINIRQVPREMLKSEAGGCGFQHIPRDLAYVNALKNLVQSLLLHKN